MLRFHRQFIVLRYTGSHTASGKWAEKLYRVVFEGANLIKISLVMAAAMLAICLLALVETTNTAEAEDSLPENGKIAFHSIALHSGEGKIYTVEPDGSNLKQLTGGTYPTWSPDGTEILVAEPDGAPVSVVSADGPMWERSTRLGRPLRTTPPGFRMVQSWLSAEPHIRMAVSTSS